jgi:hypothetical protein
MMQHSLITLLAGRRHQVSALVLMRGQTLMETLEPGNTAMLVLFRGAATISRRRVDEHVGIHLNPRPGEAVWLTHPGTYAIVAKDNVVGVRLLQHGGGAK